MAVGVPRGGAARAVGGDRALVSMARLAPRSEPAPGGAASKARSVLADGPARLLLDAVREGVAVTDSAGRILMANHALADTLGVAMAALVGQSLTTWLVPRECGTAALPPDWSSVTARRADGSEFPATLSAAAVRLDATEVFVTTVHDDTDRTCAERAGRQIHDLTEQLRRSQKVGALGRLAGGVAHDFNNLLQVIGGYAEALGAEGLDGAARRRLVRTIRGATDRAASLTRQLLAFGRRQVLVPEVVDLNVTVRTMERLASRLIGEHIRCVSVLAPDVSAVRVDPGQIEQVLLNLVLNARDAMPEGGRLEISTANVTRVAPWTTPSMLATVPPGAWVLVTVRDTGAGMDQHTAAQAFEPFFTTKDATHGSGLGLSMVYGIVKQSGGFTWIDSVPGAGASVHVLLPAVPDAAPAATREEAQPHALPVRHGTILLVEDDPEVRALFSTFLRQAGYDVLEAADGRAAVAAFDARHRDIDVLMTDVVMPNTSGPALAASLCARSPRLRVLFVSGHADQLALDGGPPAGLAYLQKPITRMALLRQVATLLPQVASSPPGPS